MKKLFFEPLEWPPHDEDNDECFVYATKPTVWTVKLPTIAESVDGLGAEVTQEVWQKQLSTQVASSIQHPGA
jgi:hypothetical protein